MDPYTENGDMIAKNGQLFRQVGWQINGGPYDGVLVQKVSEDELKERLGEPHGGFSPVYVEVGRD
jgi:hypothetical protein